MEQKVQTLVKEYMESEAFNMQVAQMVKCSVSEQIRTISFFTVPLLAIIGGMVVYDYGNMKDGTAKHTETFTQEISHLREAIVELKTTIKLGK